MSQENRPLTQQVTRRKKMEYTILSLVVLGIGFGLWIWISRWIPPQNICPDPSAVTRLNDCGPSPNCVSSCDPRSEFQVQALPTGPDPESGWKVLMEIIQNTPGFSSLESVEPQYIHAVFRTRWMKFPDDLEAFLDKEKQVIQLRSASRVGYSDLGANRSRIHKITQSYQIRMNQGSPAQ